MLARARSQTTGSNGDSRVVCVGRSRPARVQAFMDYAAQQFMNEPWAELSEYVAQDPLAD